jgi:hypothetical protein
MDPARFDRLARLVAASAFSRREGFARLRGAGLLALGLAARGQHSAAQEGTPTIGQVPTDAQALLDALDPDTRGSLSGALWGLELRADALPPETLAAILDANNSNPAFGIRMGIWLLEMIAAPVSFLPSNEERFAALLPFFARHCPRSRQMPCAPYSAPNPRKDAPQFRPRRT